MDSLKFLSEALPLYLSLIAFKLQKEKKKERIHEGVKLLPPPLVYGGLLSAWHEVRCCGKCREVFDLFLFFVNSQASS